jgi:hypothetical protein
MTRPMTGRSHGDDQAGRHHRRCNRGRPPPRHACRCRHRCGGRAARTDVGERRCGRLSSLVGLRPSARPGSALLGGGGCRQLRRRAGSLPARPWRAGSGGWSAQAAAAADRGQERRPGRPARGAGGADPRPPPGTASPGPPGSAAGAAGHPPQRLRGQGQRHQPAQGLIVGAPEELRAELRGLGTNVRSHAAQGSGTGPPGRWSTA